MPVFALTAAVMAGAVSTDPGATEPRLDAAVRRMIEIAAQSGDKTKLDAVVAVARDSNPEAAAEIDAIVESIAAEKEEVRVAKLRRAGYFDNWTGSGQLGGAISTGNSRARSLTAGLTLEKNGLRWRHRANLLVDLVDGDDDTDQERILAGYQIDYRFSDRFYTWGRLEFERNQQAGIKRRLAESAGVGWRVIAPDPVVWDLEIGPALRQTKYQTHDENRLAVRSASRFRWALSDVTSFTNETSLFWEKTASISNTAALSSRMFGALSARLSYSLVWEENPPAGLRNLDTTSRITLVYDF